MSVGIIDGDLVAGAWNGWSWAEPDWVVETIDRLSRKPFMQPDGSMVRVVPLSYFTEDDT